MTSMNSKCKSTVTTFSSHDRENELQWCHCDICMSPFIGKLQVTLFYCPLILKHRSRWLDSKGSKCWSFRNNNMTNLKYHILVTVVTVALPIICDVILTSHRLALLLEQLNPELCNFVFWNVAVSKNFKCNTLQMKM